MRDDFTTAVKDVLAKRSGMLCCNPNCRKPTSGPRDNPLKAVNIGVAAHITAAAFGGPRFDPKIEPEERASIGNAIWLCQNCAKLIDTDPDRFTVDVLRTWRRLGERQARIAVETSARQRVTSSSIKVLVVSAEDNHAISSFNKYAQQDHGVIKNVLLPTDIVDHLYDASFARLSERLMHSYDIIHFIVYVQHDGGIVMGDDTISPSDLGTLLAKRSLKCALFMTCNSANVIGALQATDVDYIIAATNSLYLGYSASFCQAFYSALSNGSTVPDAFAHANAVASVRLGPNLRVRGDLCFVANRHDRDHQGLRNGA
jgi:hypothetical protein